MGDSSARQQMRRDERGVSETLGVVLLIGLTIVGTTLTVALGGAAIEDARETTETASAQHAMTLFDARSALVALGDAGVQTVDLGRARGGSFEVREGEGWLRITHVNYNGNGDNETIYNGTLGKVVYENGNTEIAYQGGGVWRIDGNGSARMVSPPEFHYRGATLTLPVIRIEGSTAGAGASRAVVQQSETRSRVFPNASRTYDGTSRPYMNPTSNGTMMVTVHSEYYEGWASYFRARTDGNVSVDHENRTASAELVAIGMQGDFGMPADGDTIGIRGLQDDHSLTNFTIVIKPDGDDADFANMDWSLDASSGSRTLNISLAKDGGKLCKDNGGNVDVRLSYEGPEGDHEWVRDDAFTENATDFSYSCAGGTPALTINFTGTDPMTYDSGPSGMEFTQHPSDTSASEPYDIGDTEEVGYLVDHYFTLMGPTFDLEVDDFSHGNGNAGSVGEDVSYGTLSYGGGGRVVTFLHVTENEIEVRIE